MDGANGKVMRVEINGVGVAETVKTRSIESIRTFSKSSHGLRFKSTEMPSQRSAYSDLAETVKHLSRGLQNIDNSVESEIEPAEADKEEDDSKNVLKDVYYFSG